MNAQDGDRERDDVDDRLRLADLAQEHESLRRSQRRLRMVVAALAVAVAVPLISAATTGRVANELVVEEIELVGEDGTTRMHLTPQISREAVTYGRRIIRGSPDAAGIVFYDEDGEEQGAMAVLDAGGIGMGLDSKTGQNGGLFVSPDGRSMDLSFWSNRGGGHRIDLGIDAGEGPSLEMQRGGEQVLRLPRPGGDGSGKGDDE